MSGNAIKKGLLGRADLKRTTRYLREELDRSFRKLRAQMPPRAYYLSYLFRNQVTDRFWGRLGALNEDTTTTRNTVFCDVRVGSYRYDNTSEGGLSDNSDRNESVDYIDMPAELSEQALKFGLWKLTDARYREAAEQYYERRSNALHFLHLYPQLASRKRSPACVDLRYQALPEPDLDYYRRLIRKAGALIKRYPAVKNCWFEFVSHRRQHVFVSTEGREVLQQLGIFELHAHLWTLTKKGEGVSQEINLIEGNPANLPDEPEFLRLVKERIRLLEELNAAPRLNSYSGPVLLSPDASGVFFHEVVGHRLEGSRLLSADEGATFKDLRGRRIAPAYIDIVDDPTRRKFKDRQMIGTYRYDDEGNEARPAVLVKNGILRNFLTGSTPVPGQRELNGHARCQRFERPISRMGNLIVVNHKPVADEELRERFLEEIKKQGRPFGIHVKEVLGGETGTGRYDFQAFKGEIHLATRVFPDGREEPIRGVDFVGTPLSALDSVLAMGATPVMANSYCGAESGMIPVSTVAPAMLMRTLELQGTEQERLTPYLLPLPYLSAPPARRR